MDNQNTEPEDLSNLKKNSTSKTNSSEEISTKLLDNIKSQPSEEKKPEDENIDIDTVVQSARTKDLCDYVAMYRVLKIGRDVAIKCMVELDRRRVAGDNVDYQAMINEFADKLNKELQGDGSYGTIGSEVSTFWKNFGGS